MIKVLVVEDSLVAQQLLVFTLEQDPELEIVGVANDGQEAIEKVHELNPDVIAMDWYMPKLDGDKATRIIMETKPTPVVIITASLETKDLVHTFGIIEAGALAITKKPHSIDHPDYKKDSEELIQLLKVMSEVKMVRRKVQHSKIDTYKRDAYPLKQAQPSNISEANNKRIEVVAIGSSTGGPLMLLKILSGLPKNFSVPLLIVQHITPGFASGFAEWLGDTSKFPVKLAESGEKIKSGTAYVAPDGFHMGIDRSRRIILSEQEPENNLKPSVAYLFRTVASTFGANSAGVLLSGMGRDGANELKYLRDLGAVTIAQDKESSIVHGMPGEAIKLGGAMHVLSPVGIARKLISLVMDGNKVLT